MVQINYNKTPENLKRAINVYQYIHQNPGKTAYAVNKELGFGEMTIYHILAGNLFRLPEFLLTEDERGGLYTYAYLQS